MVDLQPFRGRVWFAARTFMFAAILGSPVFASCDLPPPFRHGLFATAEEYVATSSFVFDEAGVLARDYGDAYDGAGVQYNAFFITRYAHALYREYVEGGCTEPNLRDNFLTQAEWLAESHDRVDGMAYWRYPFPNARFGLEPGWISGIGQSHAAGVLLRAAAVTGNASYAALARRAIEPYFRSVASGGVAREAAYGIWFQEYPAPDGPQTDVLNGHITGLFGLIDFANLDPVRGLDALLRSAIDAVRHTVRDFDAGFTSFYSRIGPGGSPPLPTPTHGYNALHVSQLMALYEIDGDPVFLEMAMRFQAYANATYRRTASGSTAPETHGPEWADGADGRRYWSHAVFPTWYEIALPEPDRLWGVYVRSRSAASAPRAFGVSVASEGVWREVWRSENNTEPALFVRFSEPLSTDRLRLTIESDNGNSNVALQMVFPIPAEPAYGAVANECNHRFRALERTWTVNLALSGGAMPVYCDGFVVLPPTAGVVRVLAAVGPDPTIRVSASQDLRRWSEVGSVSASLTAVDVPAGHFVRLDFEAASVEAIEDIRVNFIPGQTLRPASDGPW